MGKNKDLEEADRLARERVKAELNSEGISADALNQIAQAQGEESLQAPPPSVEPTLSEEARNARIEANKLAAEATEVRQAAMKESQMDKLENDQKENLVIGEVKPPQAIKTDEELTDIRTEDQIIDAQQRQEKTMADVIADLEGRVKKEEDEGAAQAKESRSNAAWAGAAEMAAAIANLINVGNGATSQSYKGVSQDWMKKADADAREHRNRLESLRDRQNETKLKMDQLREKNLLDLQNYRRQREADQAQREYRAAQTAWQNARTESEKAEAAQKAREADLKLQYIQAQTEAYNALTRQRDSSAYKNVTTANATASGVENQNANRDNLTQARVEELNTKAALNNAKTAAAGGTPAQGTPGSIFEEVSEDNKKTGSR